MGYIVRKPEEVVIFNEIAKFNVRISDQCDKIPLAIIYLKHYGNWAYPWSLGMSKKKKIFCIQGMNNNQIFFNDTGQYDSQISDVGIEIVKLALAALEDRIDLGKYPPPPCTRPESTVFWKNTHLSEDNKAYVIRVLNAFIMADLLSKGSTA